MQTFAKERMEGECIGVDCAKTDSHTRGMKRQKL